MNVAAITTAVKCILDPRFYLPHASVQNFGQLPIPISKTFKDRAGAEKEPNIKAIVLDKDNCFAVPRKSVVYPEYKTKFEALLKAYPKSQILIVSNSAGLRSKDPSGVEADLLETNTGVKVLRHSVPKPNCGHEIIAHFGNVINSPSEIAVVGDRLLTDVIMANLMGSYSIWIRQGVIPDRGFVTQLEFGISNFLTKRGFKPPGI